MNALPAERIKGSFAHNSLSIVNLCARARISLNFRANITAVARVSAKYAHARAQADGRASKYRISVNLFLTCEELSYWKSDISFGGF